MKRRKTNNRGRYRGERGKQKIDASGHLAPTIQIRKGIFYQQISGIDEQERRAKLHNHPEDVPHWFVWLYQWGEKNPVTDSWRTLSVRVPVYIVHSVQYMINAEKPIAEILSFIRDNKVKQKKTSTKKQRFKGITEGLNQDLSVNSKAEKKNSPQSIELRVTKHNQNLKPSNTNKQLLRR